MTEPTHLDPSLKLRNGQWADLESVAQLAYDVSAAFGDTSFTLNAAELANEWKNEGFIVERDVFVVETKDGRIVGSEEFYKAKDHHLLKADGFVHPDFKGLGIGSSLLQRAEERAQAEMELASPDLQVSLQCLMDNKDETGHALLHTKGYSPTRYYWSMEVNLEGAPPAPLFPAEIELRPFNKDEHAVAVWQADNEVFHDHWGSHEASFEEWSHAKFGNPKFDPTLWMIAWEGDQIAGFSQNRYRMGKGWVGTIGVRRPWRKKGLGLALLHQTFGEFYNRGMKTIGLGVDSSNPTGATHLYERAGMHVVSEYVKYEKRLRAGKTESNDSSR
jgi:mycothiol synthase